MKIHDVLDERDRSRFYLEEKHREMLRKIKEKQLEKERIQKAEEEKNNCNAEKKELKSKEEALKREIENYKRSLERIKAAAICAEITKGKEITKANEEFLLKNFPNMMDNATIVKNKIDHVLKLIEKNDSKEFSADFLQSLDKNILSMPYTDDGKTVFEVALERINKKKK